jgi:subtilisin family serine protease
MACTIASVASGDPAKPAVAKTAVKRPLVLRHVDFPNAAAPSLLPESSRGIRTVTGPANGVSVLRALGPRAAEAFAPTTGLVGALVALPDGSRAEDFGLSPVAPGIGRLRARPEVIDAFALAHPSLHVEVAPPLYPLNDNVQRWVGAARARSERLVSGRNVFVGVADTGLDVTHLDLRDANGKSRVKWMLDLSLAPTGRHPELEQRFGVKDDSGKLTGAVFSNADIDELLAAIDSKTCVEGTNIREPDGSMKSCAPSDEVGHGTHVSGIAAGSGELGRPVVDANGAVVPNPYGGVAPLADIIFVRVTRKPFGSIENDDFVRAVEFMFERADAEKKPLVANMSLGSDFGPHDGTFLWEKAVASFVGPDKPGHAIVVAAGNSGSIVEQPIHQSVRASGGVTRVPITTYAESGAVQVWITLRGKTDLRIGLESPEGVWIPPIEEGTQRGIGKKDVSPYQAGVIYGSTAKNSQIPSDSRGAVVVWTGRKWPSGTYYVTLEGEGSAELYLQGIGNANRLSSFTHGVREGTVNLPATHPSIIGVGCTINRTSWRGFGGPEVFLSAPTLDEAGGLPRGYGLDPSTVESQRSLAEGEVCWFSSAGPTVTGVQKPEIAAPGGIVASAMSRNADPSTGSGMFIGGCSSGPADSIERCRQVDATHATAWGTSMSSPVVAGIVALLLERDPTLTQDKIVALLQAGAHRFRGPAPFDEQSGPGEADVMGSLDALGQMQTPELVLPVASRSWVTLSTSYVAADASRSTTAILELRREDGRAADLFDLRRLEAFVVVAGERVSAKPEVRRRGPGVYVFEWTAPTGLGGSSATFGALFDGVPVVPPRTIPIATDEWTARYPTSALGSSCSMPTSSGRGPSFAGAALAAAFVFLARRRRASSQ